MIDNGYFAKMKTYPKTDILLAVTRWYPRHYKGFKWVPDLAPSSNLVLAYKEGTVTWETYENHYRREMTLPKPRRLIQFYAEKSRIGQVIRLLCFERDPPCHRFILQELIEEASR